MCMHMLHLQVLPPTAAAKPWVKLDEVPDYQYISPLSLGGK